MEELTFGTMIAVLEEIFGLTTQAGRAKRVPC